MQTYRSKPSKSFHIGMKATVAKVMLCIWLYAVIVTIILTLMKVLIMMTVSKSALPQFNRLIFFNFCVL